MLAIRNGPRADPAMGAQSMADEAAVDQVDDEEIEGADQLGDAGKRALETMKAKLREARGKVRELQPFADKAREADEAAKSELQKATDRTTAAEERAAKAELALLKRDAAEEAGLPRAWADRLKGSTAEELLADAKNLAKEVGPKDVPPPRTTGRPVADLRPGALPAGDGATAGGFNADDWLRKQAGK